MKRVMVLVAAVLMVGFVGTAFADLVQLKENGVNPANAVNTTIPGIGNIGVYAGHYVLEIQNSPAWNGIYNGFCVDPVYSNSSFSQYNIVPVAHDGSVYERAAWLFDTYGSTAPTATQLAIWEVVFDPGNYNVLAGNFTVNDAAWQTDAQNEVNAAQLANLASFDPTGYYRAESPPPAGGPDYQDYLIHKSVPEPSLLLLLGASLLGIGGFRKSFKR